MMNLTAVLVKKTPQIRKNDDDCLEALSSVRARYSDVVYSIPSCLV